MKATTELRDQILEALDPLFAEEGFSRRKGHFAFRRVVTRSLTQAVHLNFGMSESTGVVFVRPSVGVRYEVIERALIAARVVDKASSQRATVARSLSPAPYEATIADGAMNAARSLWADWQSVGRQLVAELSIPKRVIELLASEDRDDWGMIIPGMRRRLLLLFLDAEGRRSEALSLLDMWEQTPERDQVVAPFDSFASWFRGSTS